MKKNKSSRYQQGEHAGALSSFVTWLSAMAFHASSMGIEHDGINLDDLSWVDPEAFARGMWEQAQAFNSALLAAENHLSENPSEANRLARVLGKQFHLWYEFSKPLFGISRMQEGYADLLVQALSQHRTNPTEVTTEFLQSHGMICSPEFLAQLQEEEGAVEAVEVVA